MPTEDLLEVCGPDEILVHGTRVPIECLIYAYQRGFSAEEIVAEYPSVGLARTHAVIAHYLDHRAEVEDYLTRVETAQTDRARDRALERSPLRERLRQLKGERTHRSGGP